MYYSPDNKYYIIDILTQYIVLIKKFCYEQNLVYYQILLIDSLTKQIMNEDRLNKALKVSQMTQPPHSNENCIRTV